MSNDQSQNTAAAAAATPAAAAPAAAAPAAPDHASVLKALEAEATDLLHRIGETVTTEDKFASRELSLAKTKLEEFVQWVEAHFKKAAAK
jgi:hypothetical protein